MIEPQTKAKTAKAKKGFTLVELIAVMAIIGILAMMIIPQFTNATDAAKAKSFENTARTLVSQATMFIANNNGEMPAAADLPILEEGLPQDWRSRIADSTITLTIEESTVGTAARGEAIIATMVLGDKTYAYVYDFDTGVMTKGNEAPTGVGSYTPEGGTAIADCWFATGDWGKVAP